MVQWYGLTSRRELSVSQFLEPIVYAMNPNWIRVSALCKSRRHWQNRVLFVCFKTWSGVEGFKPLLVAVFSVWSTFLVLARPWLHWTSGCSPYTYFADMLSMSGRDQMQRMWSSSELRHGEASYSEPKVWHGRWRSALQGLDAAINVSRSTRHSFPHVTHRGKICHPCFPRRSLVESQRFAGYPEQQCQIIRWQCSVVELSCTLHHPSQCTRSCAVIDTGWMQRNGTILAYASKSVGSGPAERRYGSFE